MHGVTAAAYARQAVSRTTSSNLQEAKTGTAARVQQPAGCALGPHAPTQCHATEHLAQYGHTPQHARSQQHHCNTPDAQPCTAEHARASSA
jgi:hypothetical protein